MDRSGRGPVGDAGPAVAATAAERPSRATSPTPASISFAPGTVSLDIGASPVYLVMHR